MKSLITAALLASMALPAAAQMNDDQRSDLREEIRAYLLDNPEVLLEAMQVLRDREENAEAREDQELLSSYDKEIFNDGVSFVGGNPEGDITIVEFMDYRCGYCRKAHADVAKLLKADGNIRLILKEFPVLGADSDASAKLAVATLQHYGPEAYEKLHNVLMAFKGPVNPDTMPQITKQAGLDFAPLADLIDSDAVAAHLQRTETLGRNLKITGTPAFVMHNTFLRGYVPFADMQQIVAQIRENL